MGSPTCSQPMELNLCDPRGDLWTMMRLWIHVLAGTCYTTRCTGVRFRAVRTAGDIVRLAIVLWCPPSSPFTSDKMSSSTRRAWHVQHRQDFQPWAQYMYEKHFHDAKSWPLCCISPAPAPSDIALLHRKCLKRTHEVLNFLNSRNLKSRSHIFNSYILLNFHTNKYFTITELPRSILSCLPRIFNVFSLVRISRNSTRNILHRKIKKFMENEKLIQIREI